MNQALHKKDHAFCMVIFLLFTCIVLSMNPATKRDIFVSLRSFELVLIHKLYRYKSNSPPMHRKASPRQVPACIISHYSQFVSPFANNLHKTCNLHLKKPGIILALHKKRPCVLHDLIYRY